MVCKSCSAEYEDNNLICPYCGSENKEAVREIKEDILEHYDEEADMIRKSAELYPEKTARKWTKHIVYLLTGLIAVGVLIGILAIPLGKLSVSMQYKREKKHLAKLEELYVAGDYAAVDAYLDDKDLYEAVYKKYEEVSRVYTYEAFLENDFQHVEEILASEMLDEDKEKHVNIWCENILEDAAMVMRLSEKYENEMPILENEEVLERFYKDTVLKLEKMGYSEEEILQIAEVEKENVPLDLLKKAIDFYRN